MSKSSKISQKMKTDINNFLVILILTSLKIAQCITNVSMLDLIELIKLVC